MKSIRALLLFAVLAPWGWTEEVNPTQAVLPPVDGSPEAVQVMEDGSEPAAQASATTVVPSETAPETTTVAPTPTNAEASTPDTAISIAVVEPTESGLPAGSHHKVVKGDTLWDLAGSYMRNPFLWTKIYEANRDQIPNPDLIYPEQEFVIPSVDAAAALEAATPAEAPPAEEPAAAVPAPVESPAAPVAEIPTEEPVEESASTASAEDAELPPEPEPKTVAQPEPSQDLAEANATTKKKYGLTFAGAGFMGGMADTFIADENWEYDGYIIRDRDLKMMISQGDMVYLNIGTSAGVKSKMTAQVFRVGRKVKDPYLKKQSGRLVKRVGSVLVTGHVSEEGCTAVVTNSLEPIRVGDIVKFMAR